MGRRGGGGVGGGEKGCQDKTVGFKNHHTNHLFVGLQSAFGGAQLLSPQNKSEEDMPPPELSICQSLQNRAPPRPQFLQRRRTSQCLRGPCQPRPVSEELNRHWSCPSCATKGFLRSLWSGRHFLGSPSQDQLQAGSAGEAARGSRLQGKGTAGVVPRGPRPDLQVGRGDLARAEKTETCRDGY